METTTLGVNGPVISRLGFGGCPLGGHGWGDQVSDTEGVAAVRCALEQGITFFDTADVYGLGLSEERLADALGDQRHNVTVATKFGVRWNASGKTSRDLSVKYLRAALDASLTRLRVERIPLYYAHWPDGVTPVEDVVEELERQRQQGKIGAIGLSNFSAAELERASDVARITALQLQFSLVDREACMEVAATAKRLGTSLVTWGSLAQGLLTGKFDANSKFAKNDRRHRYENFTGKKFASNLTTVEQVRGVAERAGKSPAQVAMRWILDTLPGSCVLFGAKRPSQVRDNVGAAGWRLDDQSYALLSDSSQLAQSA